MGASIMPGPIKVIDIELSQQLQDIRGLSRYFGLKVLVRLYGYPIGYVSMPIYGDHCPASMLVRSILDQYSWQIIRQLMYNGLAKPLNGEGLCIENLLQLQPPAYNGPKPLVTVVVCTRDRTDDLGVCLDSLINIDYPALDLLVVDNAPDNDSTKQLVGTKYPNIRYVCEPRPGLDWARNRAIIEAHGEIIAYTDDDVVVDPGWVSALVNIFAENDDVMAITGLVVPYELETDAQILFEKNGGFGRGFERKWYCLGRENGEKETYHIGAGIFGTGANMAFRRGLFDQIGNFDPALDVGTVTNGGGDLDMFFRVLQEGHTLVYEPSAIVRHRHRREYKNLRNQITNNGIGFYSFLVRNIFNYPREFYPFVRFGIWWLWHKSIRSLLISYIHPFLFPRDLILAELMGSVIGLFRYLKARRTANKIARTFGPIKRIITMEPVLPTNISDSCED